MRHFSIRTLIISLAIIASSSVGAYAQKDNLGTQRWTVTQVYSQQAMSLSAYFAVGSDQTKFTGDTGCNRMFGTVAINGGRINFTNIGTTKRMCKKLPGSIPENTLTRALDEAVRYQRNGVNLNLYNRLGRLIMRLVRMGKQPPPESEFTPALADRKWMLESVGNRKTFAALRDGFVVFDPEKRSAGGNLGCNLFGGSYSLQNEKIAITGIISTMRACIEDDKIAVERDFLDGLRTANRYEIKDGRLFLFRGQTLLLTLRGEAK